MRNLDPRINLIGNARRLKEKQICGGRDMRRMELPRLRNWKCLSSRCKARLEAEYCDPAELQDTSQIEKSKARGFQSELESMSVST